ARGVEPDPPADIERPVSVPSLSVRLVLLAAPRLGLLPVVCGAPFRKLAFGVLVAEAFAPTVPAVAALMLDEFVRVGGGYFPPFFQHVSGGDLRLMLPILAPDTDRLGNLNIFQERVCLLA